MTTRKAHRERKNAAEGVLPFRASAFPSALVEIGRRGRATLPLTTTPNADLPPTLARKTDPSDRLPESLRPRGGLMT
jgi:hypothetical protein